MNLRDQLKEILPEILPRNPAESIKGTELIELVKYRLHQDYSDATLRYHFSIMSCDPSSPIAKVEQGQGYYLRSTTIHSLNSARNLITMSQGLLGEEMSMSGRNVDIALARANRFRALFQRAHEMANAFPFIFERSFSDAEAGSNRWRYPDAAVLEWLVGEPNEGGGFDLNSRSLEIRRRLGQAPFRITSVKLKLETSHKSVREDFFQCVSTAGWANAGELVVAAPIVDEQLVEEIRQLANRFKVGVTTFGLEPDVIDDLPEPAAILNLKPREFDAIQSLFTRRRIASPAVDAQLDWQYLETLAEDSPDFDEFIQWISGCLIDEQAHPVPNSRSAVSSKPAAASATARATAEAENVA